MAYYKVGTNSGGGVLPTGNAVEANVLKDKTFSNADGIDKVGTMPNNGAVNVTLDTTTTSYTVPEGYHNGTGTVSISTQSKTVTPSARSATASTVTPDSGKVLSEVTVDTTSVPNANTDTYSATSRGSALDMGSTNTYRYVNTTGVPNTNSGTYTFASGDTGGTKDLGETNTYRYVNATNVYNKGKSDGQSASLSFATGSYRQITSGTINIKNEISSIKKGDYFIILFDSGGMSAPTQSNCSQCTYLGSGGVNQRRISTFIATGASPSIINLSLNNTYILCVALLH